LKIWKTPSGHKLWVIANFLKTSIHDSCVSHTYVICIFSEPEFFDESYENKIDQKFLESAHAKFWKSIFAETRGRNFFSFSNSKTTQKSTSNDIHGYKIYPTHAYAERNFNFWGSLTPTHDGSIFLRLEIMTIVFGRFDYLKKVRNKVYLAMFYTEKLCFSRQKWKRPIFFGLNHNYESWWLYNDLFHRKADKISHPKAFIVFKYLFNLCTILRDLEQNGVQNAICAPGVKEYIYTETVQFRFVVSSRFKSLNRPVCYTQCKHLIWPSG